MTIIPTVVVGYFPLLYHVPLPNNHNSNHSRGDLLMSHVPVCPLFFSLFCLSPHPLYCVPIPDNHYDNHNCGDRLAYVSVCPLFFSLFCLPPYLFDTVCLSSTIIITMIYLSHMYARMPAPFLIGDSYVLRLFNHVDDRHVAQITSIFHRSTFSPQAWFCILQHVTIFLAISAILPLASDVGMPCHPLTSAIRCALIPCKIRVIQRHSHASS
jgi:hypothetical protein